MKEKIFKQLDEIDQTISELKHLINQSNFRIPTIYLTIYKGVIVEVHATEKILLSIQNRDNLEKVDKDDVTVWEHMIEQGLNSGELVKIDTP